MRFQSMKLSILGGMSLAMVACGAPEADPANDVILGVNYVGAVVSDLDATAKMYETAAGLSVVDRSSISDNAVMNALAGRDVIVDTMMMRGVNAQIRFMQFSETSAHTKAIGAVPVQGSGIAHVCYQVNRETDTYGLFLDQGAKIMGDKEMQQLNDKNPVSYAYVHDLDNLVVEIEHVDITKLPEDMDVQHDRRLRHVGLSTPDIKRSVAFYKILMNQPAPRKFYGLGPFSKGASGEKIDKVSGLQGTILKFAWFQTRNLEFEIIQYASHPTIAKTRPIDAYGYNMVVFDVTDIDKAKARFIDAGGDIVSDIGEMDGGKIIFGRDPDGNLIGLQQGANAIVDADQFKNQGI